MSYDVTNSVNTKPKNLFVILAPSRSGKDSLARILTRDTQAVNFKWSSYVKAMVEQAYGLKPGDLEDPAIKYQYIPGTSISYQQVLVDFFHKQSQLADPWFFKRQPLATLCQLMFNSETVVSTDTRNALEVSSLIELGATYGYRLHLIKLEREGIGGISSDNGLVVNYQRLLRVSATDYNVTIKDSPGYLEELEELTKTILSTIP